jgi:GT2 family glycosyltransferase
MWPTLAPPSYGRASSGAVPTFSVLVAAYQAAGFIGEALTSVLSQSTPPLEVIVCDDGSTDDLAGAVGAVDTTGRVRVVRIAHGGEAAAKNAAAREAVGDYLVILDSDDVYLPGRLEALGALAAERPDLDILTTDAWLEINGRRIGRCYEGGNSFAVDVQRTAILERNFVFGLAAIRRQRFLETGGFDEDIGYTTDWELWIRMILDGSSVGLVDVPLAAYRLRESAMSSRREQMAYGRLQTLRKALAHPRLADAERDVLLGSIRREQARFDREALQSAVVGGLPGVRRLAGRVLLGPDQPTLTRAKAVAAALFPGPVGAAVRRRQRGHWVGVGDRIVPREA